MSKSQMTVPANRGTKNESCHFIPASTHGTNIITASKRNFFFANVATLPEILAGEPFRIFSHVFLRFPNKSSGWNGSIIPLNLPNMVEPSDRILLFYLDKAALLTFLISHLFGAPQPASLEIYATL